MKLSKNILKDINAGEVSVPGSSYFDLPEKVLQFGTGVLLRGLPDYYIDKANKENIFNGRIVVVKSTATSGADTFDQQDGLYTHCIRGISGGNLLNNYIVNASIRRVLSAAVHWKEILALSASADMQIIISNTTEAGLVLMSSDRINAGVPASFPGKLLAFLHSRWKHFSGSSDSGMVILPTELVPENANLLEDILDELAQLNELEDSFIVWLHTANHFCNTLVDRIVPGKLSADMAETAAAHLGYEDDLMIMSEPFSLWAIESDNDEVRSKLSFSKADKGIVIAPSITKFRELKLRLLNGTHTFSCAPAILAGFETVKEAMSSTAFVAYLNQLMQHEIAICIMDEHISPDDAIHFSEQVLERFANPYIEHRWISIAVNFTEKMCRRNLPLIQKYYGLNNQVPEMMTIGFAAFLFFMRSAVEEEGKYSVSYNGRTHQLEDPNSIIFCEAAKSSNTEQYVHKILANQSLWQMDLSVLNGFENELVACMGQFETSGVNNVLEAITSKNAGE